MNFLVVQNDSYCTELYGNMFCGLATAAQRLVVVVDTEIIQYSVHNSHTEEKRKTPLVNMKKLSTEQARSISICYIL